MNCDCRVIIPTSNPPLEILGQSLAVLLHNSSSYLLEVIIVDDGSSPPLSANALGLKETSGSESVKLIHQENAGVSVARNRGVRKSNGTIVAFLDDDCIPTPGWVNAISEPVRNDQSVAAGGRTLSYDSRSVSAQWADFAALLREPIRDRYGNITNIITANCAYARDVFLSVGGFDPVLRRSQDLDLTFRLREHGYGDRIHYAPDAIVRHSHRASVGEFLKQGYLNGMGGMAHCLLRRRNPIEVSVVFPTFAGNALKTSQIAGLTLFTAVKALREKGLGSHLLTFPLLTFLRLSAYQLGSMVMYRRFRKTGTIEF